MAEPVVATDGNQLFKLYYRTNDTFLSNYDRDQIEKAEIKKLQDLKTVMGELCFIVPSRLHPPGD